MITVFTFVVLTGTSTAARKSKVLYIKAFEMVALFPPRCTRVSAFQSISFTGIEPKSLAGIVRGWTFCRRFPLVGTKQISTA